MHINILEANKNASCFFLVQTSLPIKAAEDVRNAKLITLDLIDFDVVVEFKELNNKNFGIKKKSYNAICQTHLCNVEVNASFLFT